MKEEPEKIIKDKKRIFTMEDFKELLNKEADRLIQLIQKEKKIND